METLNLREAIYLASMNGCIYKGNGSARRSSFEEENEMELPEVNYSKRTQLQGITRQLVPEQSRHIIPDSPKE